MVAELQVPSTQPGAHVVTKDEIAERAGVRLATLITWMVRHRDFPAPQESESEEPVWSWHEVRDWLRARAGEGEPSAGAGRTQ